jgi:hypothetical protein
VKRWLLIGAVLAVVLFVVIAAVNGWVGGAWGALFGLLAGSALGPLFDRLFDLLQRLIRHDARRIDPDRLADDRGYLQRLQRELDKEAKEQPLVPTQDQVIQQTAEISEPIVPPWYEVYPAVGGRKSGRDEGKRTKDLVGFLLNSDIPVVVLGDPGSGKSISLQQVARALIKDGLQSNPWYLPVYLRLGAFTQPLPPVGSNEEEGTEEQEARMLKVALGFVKKSLRDLGPAAYRLADDLDSYVGRGRVVFLLDAMDEMRRDDYAERFEALSSLRACHPSKLLFACRKLDFRHTFPFQRCEIQPFDTRQVRALLTKVLGAEGRIVARKVLAPANDLRDLASNPFFLRLLAEFTQARKDLPRSRAVLMEVHEGLLLKRAKGRDDFPPILRARGVEAEAAFRAVLSRLAYLITVSRRGVTLRTRSFESDFLPKEFSPAERKLDQYGAEVARAVLDVAKRERILRVGNEQLPDGGSVETLSFHHHRLQEYYCALYLDVFKPEVTWQDRWDDIWWQETLIMLVGIAKEPDKLLEDLLTSLPEKAVVCSELGSALTALVMAAEYAEFRYHRNQAEASEQVAAAIENLGGLDHDGWYGLRDLADSLKEDEYPEEIPRRLVAAGLLGDPPVLEKLFNLSPEPDADGDKERIRRWLESRNAVVLDRVDLAAECGRNTTRALSEKVGARVTALLLALSRHGNTVEAVRAIQASVKLAGTEPFDVAEWSLLHRNAWCRREGFAAIAAQPLRWAVSWRRTGVVAFIQFLKGELLFAIPQFLRSVGQNWSLMWLVPPLAVLAVVSVAGVLSPVAIYWILLHRYPDGVSWLNQYADHSWQWWAFTITIAVTAWAYLTKVAWRVSILRTTVYAIGTLIFVPPLVELWTGIDGAPTTSGLPLHEWATLTIHYYISEPLVPYLATAAAILALLVVQALAVLVAAGVWSALTLSPVVLRGAVAFLWKGELYRHSDYLGKVEKWAIKALMYVGGWGLIMIVTGIITWVVTLPPKQVWLAVLGVCAAALIILTLVRMVPRILGAMKRARRQQMAEFVDVVWDFAERPSVWQVGLLCAVTVAVILAAFRGGIFGMVGRFLVIALRFLWSDVGPYLLTALAIILIGFILWLLGRRIADETVFLMARIFRWKIPLGHWQDAHLLWIIENRKQGGKPLSAREQYDIVRDISGRLRSNWARAVAEQRLYQLQKEARQEALGSPPRLP